MNKIFMLLVAMSCSLGMNAQDKKDLQKAIQHLESQKKELETLYLTLKSNNSRIEKRKFETESPEQSLRNRLAFYKDIKDMADDNIFERIPSYKNFTFANRYTTVIDMYHSLSKKGGYKQDENETYKSQLDAIREQILSMRPEHQDSFIQSFDELDNCIRNYRFTMFELARLFELAKKKEESENIVRDGIYKSLQEDEETDFVDRIPYAKMELINYAKGDDFVRAEIVKELKDSCKEAFTNFD